MSDIFHPYRVSDTLVDLREVVRHPAVFRYTEIYREMLILAKVSGGRVAPRYILNGDAPFCVAAKEGLSNPSSVEAAVQASLSRSYAAFQPQHISDWFGLQSTSMHHFEHPAWCGILPWRARTLESYRDAIASGTYRDNQEANLDMDIHQGGWAHAGPVTDEKCAAEAHRLAVLIESIGNHGYLRHHGDDGDIVATALINERGAWTWVVSNGYHRAAVLAAMGHDLVPVRINQVVRRDEVNHWPQVLVGFYTRDEALHIFDTLFHSEDGTP